MRRATALTALAGALMALVVMGALVALDRTTLHWYAPDVEDLRPDIVSLSRDVTSIESRLGTWPSDDVAPITEIVIALNSRLQTLERCLRSGLSVYVYDIDVYYGEGYGETDSC